jgi:6-pyruvoyltetrahydropterin/6-carboxytetrahydropterin synthase
MHSIRVTDPDMGFSSAHFVVTEEGYEALHGHNYTVEVTIEGNLDEYGMIIDFRQVKREVSRVCKSIDHRVLLPGISPHMTIVEDGGSVVVNTKERKYSFPVTDCLILPLKATTAEMIAKFIHDEVGFPAAGKVTVCVSESKGACGCYTRNK